MICTEMNGGLGNQMFQYACGKALATQNKTPLVVSLLHFNIETGKRKFELRNVFMINVEEVKPDEYRKLTLYYDIVNWLSYRLRRKGAQTSKYFIENKFSYNQNIKKVGKDCYISGYWQSQKYFNFIEDIIRKDFTFHKPLEGKNIEIANRIEKSNSISLHIRRTDYFTSSVHHICSLDYYNKAVEIVSTKIKNPHFFVFSDDINWAEENLKLPYEMTFITDNNAEKSYIDMQLMSICKHNIIANSTFSWWGAWLNSNENKIVIAPKIWFVGKSMNNQTNDLIPEKWHRI